MDATTTRPAELAHPMWPVEELKRLGGWIRRKKFGRLGGALKPKPKPPSPT